MVEGPLEPTRCARTSESLPGPSGFQEGPNKSGGPTRGAGDARPGPTAANPFGSRRCGAKPRDTRRAQGPSGITGERAGPVIEVQSLPPASLEAQGGHQGRSETVAGRLLGLSRRLLGPSWGALGASGRCPGPPPEAPREPPGGYFGSYFCNARSGTLKFIEFLRNFVFLRASLCVFLKCFAAALWRRRYQREL